MITQEILDTIQEKVKEEVEHVVTTHFNEDLVYKMECLAYSWYLKGLESGIILGKLQKS